MTDETDGATRVEMTDLLGQIIVLMGQSASHRHLFLSDLEWLVMPAIGRRQMRLWRRDTERGPIPAIYASWAFVSPEVDQRFASGRLRLTPAEWTSGEMMWLIDLVAPMGGADAAIKEMTGRCSRAGLSRHCRPPPAGCFGQRVLSWPGKLIRVFRAKTIRVCGDRRGLPDRN